MVILDTNMITVVMDGAKNPDYQRLAARLDEVSEGPVIAITSAEECLKGWLSYCAKAKTPEEYIDATRKLHAAVDFLADIEILDFDDRAAAEFKQLKVAKIRIGTMDLRIASIALVYGATLVTANVSDFRKVPGLAVEDWTKPDLGS